MDLVLRSKKDLKPLLFKLGVAIAVSFAGFLFSQLRGRRRNTNPSNSSRSSENVAKMGGAGLKEELRILKTEGALAKITSGAATTMTTTTTTTTTVVGLSPHSRSSADDDGFLLPEFIELVDREIEMRGREDESMARKDKMEQEIVNLRKLVMSLHERERSLELQLLEYYGMQEQEAAMRELENQLKINSVEAKLYSLKIESLQNDNRMLQAQVAENSRVLAELEAAKNNIKVLKKKLKVDAEQAKEKIASLHQRINMLQCRENDDAEEEAEIERKMQELADEIAKLRRVNSSLVKENSVLAEQLESTHIQISVLERPEAEALEEAKALKQANEKLKKDIEQLHTDRCTDVEELVYLRWVNACLRYELRNYQPPPGKTVARDLSKNLSPTSEEKAKQLIMEYANAGEDEKNLSLIDFDSEYSSSSREFSGEIEDAVNDSCSVVRHGKPNKKLISKLKTLVLGKESNKNKHSVVEVSPTSSVSLQRRASYNEDSIGRMSQDSYSSCLTEELTSTSQFAGIEGQGDERRPPTGRFSSYSRPCLDMQRVQRHSLEETIDERCEDGVESPRILKRLVLGDERLMDCSAYNEVEQEEGDTPEKMELKKFAAALNRSRGTNRHGRRSASFST